MIYKIYNRIIPSSIKTGMTEHLRKQSNKNLIGAELGVKNGVNALSILKHLNIEKLYLVDHYEKYVEYGKEMDFSSAFPIAVHKLRKYKDKVVFIKKDVNDAMSDIKESLDFVWMDANGDYDIVYNYLKNYYPLMNLGGLIGGKRFNSNWFPLCRAVFDFVDENSFKLVGCNTGDWWIVKK